MSKYEKEMGIPKPSTVKRIDPPEKPRKKAGRSRKVYPPCWEVRHHFWGYSLDPHKVRPDIPRYWSYEQTDPPNRKDLVSYLAWWAERHPHTANLPVRFISCQPIECGREIIPN